LKRNGKGNGMTLFCGIVLNKDDINITIIDERQNEVVNEDVPNDASRVIAVLAPHRGELQSIVMEACKNPEWLMDALRAEGYTNVHSVE
jgi:hypothetical protein